MNKKTMYNLTYGLFVLTSACDGRDSGCIINTAGQVTSEPNRISIAVNKANFTQELIQKSGRFNVSILAKPRISVCSSASAFSPDARQTNLPVLRTVSAAKTVSTTSRPAPTVISALRYGRVSIWEAILFSSLLSMTWRFCPTPLPRPTPTTSPPSSLSPPGSRPARRSGGARSAAIPTKATSSRPISPARFASTRRPISRK